MPLPVAAALPWLFAAAAGAYVGSQVDDKIETPAADTPAQSLSPTKIFMYSAMALGLFWGARKAGVLK